MVNVAELTPENDRGYGSGNILIPGMEFHPAVFFISIFLLSISTIGAIRQSPGLILQKPAALE